MKCETLIFGFLKCFAGQYKKESENPYLEKYYL